jgi:hypothetical protein
MCERIAARAGLHPIWGLNWEPGFTLIGTQLDTTPPDWRGVGFTRLGTRLDIAPPDWMWGGFHPVGEGSTVGR